ncbi:MAG: hypothetical protein KF815_06595 [Rhodospirillales bacterium]|jgi:chaperone modulatory protein CbpM|nr:hypothetical protein [Rhodospirillales bacterium]MDG4576016.1 chaperone modulator CbpM [Defluviicoccus sp.]MDG4593324.1 chaperone modulator CbpM [Defluviicoccus sp.]MDG4602641.1 chaperone modulator CbpM [Defluviicoccus sp.]MDG4608334.1 chaperone modulator CbpM [Defluviicoccus sp.]
MATFEEILTCYSLERVELNAWIDQQWVRPQLTPHGPVFDEVDEARIALIRELRGEFLVGDEALGLVLSLLDQLYAARRALHTVEEALDELPEAVRQEIRLRLRSK